MTGSRPRSREALAKRSFTGHTTDERSDRVGNVGGVIRVTARASRQFSNSNDTSNICRLPIGETIMKLLLRMAALAALTACSASNTTQVARQDARLSSNDQLTLTVTDAPARPGVMFVAGTITGGQGAVTVSSTRYGSVCSTDITANADVAKGKITLTVKFAERTAICTADIRAITYRADIAGIVPGEYEVDVVHSNADGSNGTVLTQRVKVT
jgi:hypothetical protein